MVAAPLLVLLLARQASPSDTVRQFIAAWNANDHAAMAALVLGGKKTNLDLMPEALPHVDITAISEKVNGSDAIVTVTIATTDRNRRGGTETDSLKLNSGKWLLVPAKPSDADPGGLATIAAFAVNPGPMMKIANASAKATLCLSNVKQLGLGCLLYTNDHDDKFIPKGQDTHKALAPYLKNRDLWICPATGKVGYSVNAQLLGKSMQKVAKPTETIAIYEGANGKLEFRHEGRAAICFVDGHAKLVNKAEAAKLRFK